ncbi:beta-glucosidase BglX [Paenibacillus sinopodophylli]|uniref:beta-glucosidase BglX n=1 Tax=Paenibacillus sinopodophylli TaxID=1837342 RepID=UPI00110D057A|nr:beta-glucosidase BglX [Paenibacillus sinopodophylli]
MKEEELLQIINQMTVEEKIYQLVQWDGSLYDDNSFLTGPKVDLDISDDVIRNMGSVYNVFGAEKLRKLQDDHLKTSRLKIPLLFAADVVYGYKTILPIPLAFGCSWNPRLVKDGMGMVAKEASAVGIHATFSPMVDLVRDPRWGRVMESTGEDPFLNSVYARAQVEGLQDNLDHQHLAACVKHFAAYGAPEGGREYNHVDMSERRLRQDYLPAYKAAVEAGCKMVMTSFNTVDGIPATGNEWLLRDVLRKEWGFKGVVNSDYASIKELMDHGAAEDEVHAAKLAIGAGVDVDMKTSIYANHLKKAVERKELDITKIDEAVLRMLNLKNELGLFEDPFRGIDPKVEEEVLHAEGNKEIARALAQESVVLLKNDNHVLPLSKNKKVALVGPYANETSLMGTWAAAHADREHIMTLKTAMENKIGDNLLHAHGCDIVDDYSFLGHLAVYFQGRFANKDVNKDLDEALEAASQADIIVVALGEHMLQSGEAASRTDLTLNKMQVKLLEKLHELNKPIVCILFNGRPLMLDPILDKIDALVEAWFPGSEGALAITDILFGDVNPSGKLTMSFPMNVGQIPVYYNGFKTGRPYVPGDLTKEVSKYTDVRNEPRYPFGYGLSYTEFEYGDIQLDTNVLIKHKSIHASITIKNIGDRRGKETVQMYIQDIVASVVRPVKELKGFQKVQLDSGEMVKVEFVITDEDLSFFTKDMIFTAEEGKFKLFIGKNSSDVKEAAFEYVD